MNGDNETCYILIGQVLGSRIVARFLDGPFTGTPVSVEFSWKLVMEREEKIGDVLGFYHTHPAGFASVSTIDVQTMKGWVICFGKPMLCIIRSADITKAFLFSYSHYEEVEILRSYEFKFKKGNESWLRIVFTMNASTGGKN